MASGGGGLGMGWDVGSGSCMSLLDIHTHIRYPLPVPCIPHTSLLRLIHHSAHLPPLRIKKKGRDSTAAG
jgi:hypothetical protein